MDHDQQHLDETMGEPDTGALDEMIDQAGAEEQAQWEAENEPSQEEKEKARELARKINDGFLVVVNKTQCPSVDVDDLVDREQGVEALTPLAEEFGGELPEWLRVLWEQYDPYIKAGIYMGTTVYIARKVEKQIQKQREEAEKDGGQSEPGPTE